MSDVEIGILKTQPQKLESSFFLQKSPVMRQVRQVHFILVSKVVPPFSTYATWLQNLSNI